MSVVSYEWGIDSVAAYAKIYVMILALAYQQLQHISAGGELNMQTEWQWTPTGF